MFDKSNEYKNIVEKLEKIEQQLTDIQVQLGQSKTTVEFYEDKTNTGEIALKDVEKHTPEGCVSFTKAAKLLNTSYQKFSTIMNRSYEDKIVKGPKILGRDCNALYVKYGALERVKDDLFEQTTTKLKTLFDEEVNNG